MQATIISVLIATFIINVAAWNRYESFQDNFNSKRNYKVEEEEQDLLQQLRSLFQHHQKRSWQGYVDEQLVGTGLQSAAIIGHDGSTWATSAGFGLKSGECTRIVGLFEDPANVFTSGVTVNGVKYLGIKGDESSIYGKKGAGGVIIVKTEQTILIGVYDATMQPGNAAHAVENLGDYLRDNGY